jgi:hypothetical protein
MMVFPGQTFVFISHFLLKNKCLTHVITYHLMTPIDNLIVCLYILSRIIHMCVTIDGVMNNWIY